MTGWQRQKNTDRTIQGKLENILLHLFDDTVEVHGSGRTDAGVHAFAQVANFHSPEGAKEIELHRIEEYINAYLPEDISVFGLEAAPPRFHSRLSAVGKDLLLSDLYREGQAGFCTPLCLVAVGKAG